MSPRWAIVVLALALAGCGSETSDRFSLRTPGTNTGAAAPAASATPTATPSKKPAGKPVTLAERRVIRGWSNELRRGDVRAAARYFSVPTMVSDPATGMHFLETKAQVEKFNAAFPCGAKLLSTERITDGFVVGIFRLTKRAGAQCNGTGTRAAVAFRIRDDHIVRWVRADGGLNEPAPTPTPTATPSDTA
jgi:hypothetical protein